MKLTSDPLVGPCYQTSDSCLQVSHAFRDMVHHIGKHPANVFVRDQIEDAVTAPLRLERPSRPSSRR